MTLLSHRAAFGAAAAVTLAAPLPAKANHAMRPEDAGFKTEGLEQVARMAADLAMTSMMVVRGGRIAWSIGDIAETSDLASARKSMLSMLYGRYVGEGKIDLDMTIGEVGIEDVQPLLPIEKTARIRDPLTARSGVSLPAGRAGGANSGPPRGSQQPGRHFLGNDWDFDVAGTVFEKLTGKTVFEALGEDLAEPPGFQDFAVARQRMLGFPDQSRHLADHLFLSARDMARIGLVMARHGIWGEKQVIPRPGCERACACMSRRPS